MGEGGGVSIQDTLKGEACEKAVRQLHESEEVWHQLGFGTETFELLSHAGVLIYTFRLKIGPDLMEMIRKRAADLGLDVNQYLSALAKVDIKRGGDSVEVTTMPPTEAQPAPKPPQPIKPAKASTN